MTNRSIVLLLSVGLALADFAWGDNPTAAVTGNVSFYLHSEDTELQSPVSSVSLSDRFFMIAVRVVVPKPGTHEIGLVLYGPNGHEAYRSTDSEPSRDMHHIGRSYGYSFRKGDSAGTWWVSLSVDGQPVRDQPLTVSQARAAR